jgi:PIN domain nuclease of toxin-antitoxin system
MILLDSHVAAWFHLGSSKLGTAAVRQIGRFVRQGGVHLSPLSFFELAFISNLGSLKNLGDIEGFRSALVSAGVKEVEPDSNVCIRASEIRPALIDPFDALIVATADIRGMTLVTADERILGWKGRVKRIDARK